jgi:diguanylate cyclase (GGDEF)-like protein
MAISSLKNALFFLALNIMAESFIITRLPKIKDNVFTFNTHILFYVVFFLIFYFTLLYEKKQKNKYRLLLKTYDGLKETQESDLKENKKLDIAVLSEQGRKKYDISVTRKLNDKIFEILQNIKDIMHPFTIMYLEIDKSESRFFIKEVISESDHINYNLEVGVDYGYLGWVLKNKRSLNVNNFDGVIHDLFYYTSDEMIKSLIIMPATDDDKIKGVLLVDSRDFQFFSSKEENLLSLVSYQIMQELNNFKIMREIEYNARQSNILNLLGKRLNASLDLNDTIQVMITSISNLIKSNLIAVIFLNEDEMLCKINAVQGERYERLVGKEFKKDEGICNFVIEKKKKVLFKDFSSVADKKNIFDNNLKLKDMEMVFLLPLIANDIPFGAVLIANKAPINLSDNTVNTIETLVNQSAISIANAKIYLKMEMMATTDGLTGLFNHRCFQEKITEEMDRIKRYPENLSLLLMDIDHFKKFNDTYGHPIGDKVLKLTADIFSKSLRKVDFAARYGGEEFVAILVNTNKKGALKMGERIRKNIENEIINIDSKDMNITVTVGIATYPEDSKDKKGLINLADKALYYGKETGRNRCIHYQDISKEKLI